MIIENPYYSLNLPTAYKHEKVREKTIVYCDSLPSLRIEIGSGVREGHVIGINDLRRFMDPQGNKYSKTDAITLGEFQGLIAEKKKGGLCQLICFVSSGTVLLYITIEYSKDEKNVKQTEYLKCLDGLFVNKKYG